MPSLTALIASDIDVVAVVTNPDRPAGRGLAPRPSPVKDAALQAGLEVVQPERAKDPELHALLERTGAGVATVVAYGKILPPSLLEMPRRGFVNVHFSLLPSYRGAAPVQRALMDGVTETGVSIMVLAEGMDEGPVLASARETVAPDDTTGSLGGRLADVGAKLLVDTLPRYVNGAIEPAPQDDTAATYAPKIGNDEARIEWNETTAVIVNKIRALDPEPGAWSVLRGKRLKLFGAYATSAAGLDPGQLASGDELVVGTADAAVGLTEVQPAGKRRMAGTEFVRGLRPTATDRMGE